MVNTIDERVEDLSRPLWSLLVEVGPVETCRDVSSVFLRLSCRLMAKCSGA